MDLKDEWRRFLARDLRHFLVNIGGMGFAFFFYVKFGFYGWQHLIASVLLWYAVLPLDDWIEKERPFPYHAGLITIVIAFLYPLITLSVVLGNALTNLRAILKKDNFWLERVEGLGNMFVYVMPFVIPLHPVPPHIYVATPFFILFGDSFHKIGHKETKHPDAMWLTGLACLVPLTYWFAAPGPLFPILLVILIASLVPFALLKNKKHSWVYTQVWFGIAGFIAYYYYLFVVLP